MNSLIIKHAKSIEAPHDLFDIYIENGKIKAIAPNLSLDANENNNNNNNKIVDLKGQHFVSAGWIDAHTHCYAASPIYYDEPDLAGAALGVTTMIDAGSVGAFDIDHFYKLTCAAKTNVFAFLNISQIGIIVQNELADMDNINHQALKDALERYPHFIKGIKARMSSSVVGSNGIKPLLEAKKMQQENGGLPLMVHIGNNPPNLDEIADLLSCGDIITHCFNGKPNRILDINGQLKDSIKNALSRGVILDVGHGGASFSFDVAEQAMRIGTYPDLISSDIYHKNRTNGQVCSLAFVMSKFLCMGFSMPQILACVTHKAADLLHLEHKGYLKVGYDADITIFDIKNERIELTDAHGEIRIGAQSIVPIAAIVNGEFLEDINKA
ncbi:dihydroorotase [Gammaproteobacteria bacterium]|nr:dihydroorotase [Gammaproteobacteria bacterium]